MKKMTVIIAAAVLITATLAAAYFAANRSQVQRDGSNDQPSLETSTPTSQPTIFLTPTSPPTDSETGIIEGSLSFPSEGIPDDMQVCAETLQGEVVSCTSEQIQDENYQYGVGYQLDLAPGDYYVYAQLPDAPEQKAYYNEFVTCGLSVECESHENIIVTVTAGETISGVDPQDWYNNP